MFTKLPFEIYAIAIPPLIVLTLGKAAIWRVVWQAPWRWCIVVAAITNGSWAFLTLGTPLIPIGILLTGTGIGNLLPRTWVTQLDAALRTDGTLPLLIGVAVICLLIALIEFLVLIGFRQTSPRRCFTAALASSAALCVVVMALTVFLFSPRVYSLLKGSG